MPAYDLVVAHVAFSSGIDASEAPVLTTAILELGLNLKKVKGKFAVLVMISSRSLLNTKEPYASFSYIMHLLLTAACSAAPPESSATLFEGARLITGDGSAVENSAFLIENTKITAVGHKGDIMAPAGAARVDLTGKTVMPALVDTHTHLGWAIIKTGRIDKDTL